MASEGPGSGGLAVPFPGLLPPPRAFSSSSPPPGDPGCHRPRPTPPPDAPCSACTHSGVSLPPDLPATSPRGGSEG